MADEGEALLENAARLLEDMTEDIRTALEPETTTSPLKGAIVEVLVPDTTPEATNAD